MSISHPSLRRASTSAALFAFLLGCSSEPIVAKAPTIGDSDDQVATCKIVKDPMNPLIIEWPGTSKVDLDAASQGGLVAVSYVGCNLKILPACNIGGGYKLTKVTPTRETLTISTKQDLYARLPLGAASLKGELARNSELDLEYVAVGQRIAQGDPSTDPKGVCEGATHYVRTITVGAYTLDAVAGASGSLGVEVANAGAGVGRTEGTKRLRGSGDVNGCSAKPDDPNCSAVLQLGLVPLVGAPPPIVAQAEPPAEEPKKKPPTEASPPKTSEPTKVAAGTTQPVSSSDSFSLSIPYEADRFPMFDGRTPGKRNLLVTELQNLESLFGSMAKTDAKRPDLLLRLATSYRELQLSASRDALSGSADERAKGVQVAKAAAKSARKYYTALMAGYTFCAGTRCEDEFLYQMALTCEAQGDFDQARGLMLDLISRWPQSKYVPAAYFAFGVYFDRDAKSDKAKWPFAEQSFSEVLKYPKSPLYPWALLLHGNALAAQGDATKARADYDKLRSTFPTSAAAKQIPGSPGAAASNPYPPI